MPVPVGLVQQDPLTAFPVHLDDDELPSRDRGGDHRERAGGRDIVRGEAVGQVHGDVVHHDHGRAGHFHPLQVERDGQDGLVPGEQEMPARRVARHHAAGDQHLSGPRFEVQHLDRRARHRRPEGREQHLAPAGQELGPPVGQLLRGGVGLGEPPRLTARRAHPPEPGLVALGIDDGAVRSPGAATPA